MVRLEPDLRAGPAQTLRPVTGQREEGVPRLLQALKRLFGIAASNDQLSLELEAAPRNAAELRDRLVRLGLNPRYRCRLTSNRTVFVSYSGDELRVHRGYLDASEDAWRAIVAFVEARSRRSRGLARRNLLRFAIDREQARAAPARRSVEKTHPDDEAMAARLRDAFESYNREKFSGMLGPIPIRVSRRMKSRLGHYTHRGPSGDGAEIVISRRHIRRHGWAEALETLVHEMIHQWQDESGIAVDHGRQFRAKARAVGISPLAGRDVA